MRDKFAQWNVLFGQYLKRDWKMIVMWVLGLGVFCGGFVPAFVEITKGQGLIGMFETLKNPAMISMLGTTPITEAADYTVGAMYSHMMLLWCAICAMVVSAMHVVRHTRREEENGLTEFICTYSIGRHAASFALVVEELVIHVLLAAMIGGLICVFDVKTMDAAPAFLFGASIGLAGMIGAVLALFMSQIMVTSGAAVGTTLGMVGLLYMVRGGTDMSNPDLSSWNPMGWIYRTYPFTENNWIFLLWGVVFCIVVVVISLFLEKGRDMGAGYLPDRGGRKKVRKSLLSVHGFLLRINRGTILGWLIALAVMGAMYGSIYGDMQTFLEGNDLLKTMFQMQGISIEASFTMTILVILSGLTMILPAALMNHLYAEETSGYFGQIYATKTSRDCVYWTNVVIAAVCAVLALLLASCGLGGAATAVMKTPELELVDFVKAGMNYFPASLFIIGLAGLVLGWFPKWGKLIYVYIIYSMMLNYFMNILNIPEWVEKTAILSWIPRMPAEEFELGIFVGIIGISVGLLILGYIGYRRRDLQETV